MRYYATGPFLKLFKFSASWSQQGNQFQIAAPKVPELHSIFQNCSAHTKNTSLFIFCDASVYLAHVSESPFHHFKMSSAIDAHFLSESDSSILSIDRVCSIWPVSVHVVPFLLKIPQ